MKTVIKENVPNRYYFFVRDVNRVFFFGDSCGYYTGSDNSVTYFDFPSLNFVISNTHKWVLFKKGRSYYSGGDFFLMNTSTLQVRQLSSNLLSFYNDERDYLESSCSFSHGDDKIVFSHSEGTQPDSVKTILSIMDINTLAVSDVFVLRILNPNPIRVLYPVFTSDNKRIFFIINDSYYSYYNYTGPKPGLYFINADGKSFTVIDTSSFKLSSNAWYSFSRAVRPAWSAKLIFYSDDDNYIHKINEDGTNNINTGLSYSGLHNQNRELYNYRVSSTGDRIVWWFDYRGEASYDDFQIYLYDGQKGITIGVGNNVIFSQDEKSIEYLEWTKF